MLGIIPHLVIAPTLAYATNEGSYKLGYNTAFNAYKCVYTDDCDMVGSQSPVYDLCALGLHSTIPLHLLVVIYPDVNLLLQLIHIALILSGFRGFICKWALSFLYYRINDDQHSVLDYLFLSYFQLILLHLRFVRCHQMGLVFLACSSL